MNEPRRILVTGATGFVGRHLLPALGKALPNSAVIATGRVVDRRPGDPDKAGADEAGGHTLDRHDTVVLDLLDPDGVERVIRTIRPDAVVHLAAQTQVPASFEDPETTWRTNLSGTLVLAGTVLRHAPFCRFVFASTAEVYGLSFRAPGPLDESALMAPANPYAASKAAADLAIGEMALRGLDAVRLRAFNHTGPGQTANFVVPSFACQVARIEMGLQEPLLRVGDLNRWRDFLDVRDICQAYVAALRMASSPGAIFNLASGTPRRVGDILDALIARAGIAPRIETEVARLRQTDIGQIAGDSRAAHAGLGWSPVIGWDQTLDDVLAYWRCEATGETR